MFDSALTGYGSNVAIPYMISEAWVEKRISRRRNKLLYEELERHFLTELALQDVRLTVHQRKRLNLWFANGCKTKISFKKLGSKEIKVNVTPRSMRRILGKARAKFLDAYQNEVDAAIKKLTPLLYRNFRRGRVEQAAYELREEAEFKRRLWKTWKRPLEDFELLISLSAELGGEISEHAWEKTSRAQVHCVDVLTKLHARACQIAREVSSLLKAGYADGAIARWRSLYEIVVTMLFLSERGKNVIQRYIDHQAVDAWRSAMEYELNAERMNYPRLTSEELSELKKRNDLMVSRYDKPFGTDYGWAAKELNNKKPTFRDIEKAASLSHWRSEYKQASLNVHAGVRGTFLRLGLLYDDKVALSGASNVGLETPGENTAISLMQANAVLLNLAPGLDQIITVHAMTRLSEQAALGFRKIAEKIEGSHLINIGGP